jgi:hypothetical protein
MEFAVLVIVVVVIAYFAFKHGDRLAEYDIARAERRDAEKREAERRAAQTKMMGRQR